MNIHNAHVDKRNDSEVQLVSTGAIELLILFMAALHSRCGHYIFALWFLLLSVFAFLA